MSEKKKIRIWHDTALHDLWKQDDYDLHGRKILLWRMWKLPVDYTQADEIHHTAGLSPDTLKRPACQWLPESKGMNMAKLREVVREIAGKDQPCWPGMCPGLKEGQSYLVTMHPDTFTHSDWLKDALPWEFDSHSVNLGVVGKLAEGQDRWFWNCEQWDKFVHKWTLHPDEFARLRKGDTLLWNSGGKIIERPVLAAPRSKSDAVKLRKLRNSAYPNPYTVYWWNDLKFKCEAKFRPVVETT